MMNLHHYEYENTEPHACCMSYDHELPLQHVMYVYVRHNIGSVSM